LEAYQSSSKEQQALAEKIGTLQMGMEKDAHAGDMEAFKIKEGRLEKALGRQHDLLRDKGNFAHAKELAAINHKYAKALAEFNAGENRNARSIESLRMEHKNAELELTRLEAQRNTMGLPETEKAKLDETMNGIREYMRALAASAPGPKLPEMPAASNADGFRVLNATPALAR